MPPPETNRILMGKSSAIEKMRSAFSFKPSIQDDVIVHKQRVMALARGMVQKKKLEHAFQSFDVNGVR